MQAQPGLNIVQGSPSNQTDIEKAFAGRTVDAVLVALNASRASDSPFSKPIAPEFFVRDCLRNLTAVMLQERVARLIVMSGFGVASSYPQLPWLMKLVFRYTNMNFQMRDHDAADEEVRNQEGLDSTFVRPAMLKEGGPAPVKEHGETGEGAMGLFSGITRASVARFMVEAAEEGRFVQQAVVIAN
jgi:putative NADH-flavin reductase